jgi:microcystin-dependent protein
MPSSYSTSLKIQLMGNGEDSGTWGTITNTNWNLMEQAVAGVAFITMSNANYTLSNLNGTSDEARNMILEVSGTNSAIYQVIAPLVPKFYVVTNNTTGGYAITIGASTGSIITVPNGTTVQVYCDGTNFYSAQTASAGNFDVNGNLIVGGNLNLTGTFNYIPSGVIQMWPTNSAPAGFLFCNGTAVSRSTYANLFAAIGTTFGIGDGSTTFNLPNYTNQMPIGAGGTYSLASTGGSTSISTANLPSHTHTFNGTTGYMNQNTSHSHSISDPGHNHTVSPQYYSQITGSGDQWMAVNSGNNVTVPVYYTGNAYTGITGTNSTDINHTHNFSGTTGATGSGSAFLPPYLAINFIIKT